MATNIHCEILFVVIVQRPVGLIKFSIALQTFLEAEALLLPKIIALSAPATEMNGDHQGLAEPYVREGGCELTSTPRKKSKSSDDSSNE